MAICPAAGADTVWPAHTALHEPDPGGDDCPEAADEEDPRFVVPDDVTLEEAVRKELQRLDIEERERQGDFSKSTARYSYVRFDGASKTLPKTTRNMLAKLHGNLGHPPNDVLARMLRLSGGTDPTCQGAKDLTCDICQRF